MVNNQYLYSDLTEQIIGCAMRVHSFFGMGFPEIVYKRALMIELDKLGIKYQSEEERDIYYDGRLISKRRLDLIVEGKVLVELKAVKEVDKSYWNQILNYLKVFGLAVGLHFNFGAESLQFKRFTYTKEISEIHPKSLNQ
jgi:GxxExxY protein